MSLSKKPYKGCRDFFPKDMRVRDYIFNQMHKTAKSFNYLHYDGPTLEEVELYKAKSGEELINDQIYSFYDRGERFVAIRPEMTPTLARMVANIHKQEQKPIRWYSIPNLMRYEKPQRGRLREHWQYNVDIFGAEKNLGEVEILSLITNLLTSFGATKTMFNILINDREVVDFVFNDLLALNNKESYKLYKVIDKAKKVTPEKLQEMIKEIITDSKKIDLFIEYLALDSFQALSMFLEKYAENKEFNIKEFITLIQDCDFNEFLTYDPTIVRGLDYYTGLVFEVFDQHPDNRRAIAGGGAYANLLQIFNEKPLPGIGFGMGDVTLKDFLETHKLLPDFSDSECDLFLTYFDDADFQYAFNLANNLRAKGIRVELNLGKIKFNKVFKIAESKGHNFVGIIGADEVSAKTFNIKNISSRDQKVIDINKLEEVIPFIKG
jgi:histidyl-tRNA synthetase